MGQVQAKVEELRNRLKSIEERTTAMAGVLDIINTRCVTINTSCIDLEAQLQQTQQPRVLPPNQPQVIQLTFQPPMPGQQWAQTWNNRAFLDVTTRSQKYQRWMASLPGPTREIVATIQRENSHHLTQTSMNDLLFATVLKTYSEFTG
jgi:hypothetical protein